MRLTSSFLPIAVRAYTPLTRERNTTAQPPDPKHIFVFDTESGGDQAQHLTFGSARLFTSDRQRLDECLFHADELPEADRASLRRYVNTHDEAVDSLQRQRLRVLTCRAFLRQVFWPIAYKGRALTVCFNAPFDLSRLSFGWGEAREQPYAGGFSLKLSNYQKAGKILENHYRPRIALKSIDSKRALIGFKRYLAPDDVDLIPEGAVDGLPDSEYHFLGHFLDLRTLAFALTNQSHSLRSACKAFGVPLEETKGRATEYGKVTPEHIDYNRQDVRATAALYWKMKEEYDRHPIRLPISKAFSPATIGKSYLDEMGIAPILERQPDFSKEILGHAMAAYYGGRAECRIRQVPLPVVYLDFLSMYPTVCSLLGIWQLLTCERIEVEEMTEEVQTLLADMTRDRCFDPKVWQQFIGLVQLVPDDHILPVRAHYGGSAAWQIGVNPLTSTEPLWYTIPDAVAATLLSGTPPRVLQAWRLVPHGKLAGLRPVKLRGQVLVDPREQDFFRVAIEERHRLEQRADLSEQEKQWLSAFLKVLANSAGYGIYAEMNPQTLPKDERQQVSVYGNWEEPFTARVHAPEEPGAYCFPPFAACIAGAARLMLALLECSVADRGGTHVMADTDSMAVVSTAAGGLIARPGGAHGLPDGREAVQALSWEEVEGIRRRFETLNPYDKEAVLGSVLKLEKENRDPGTGARRQLWCYALAAKRYCLFHLEEDGRPLLRKVSEHGLGHLLSPTDPFDEDEDEDAESDSTADDDSGDGGEGEEDSRKGWIRTIWEGIATEALGRLYTRPDWLDRPALGRITATSPQMLRPFQKLNQGKPYTQQIKPYNFLLTAQVALFGHPEGVDPEHFHLVAPFESDPRKWNKLSWMNLYSNEGERYRISTRSSLYASAGIAQVKTYRQVLEDYRTHPEAKSLGHEGLPCNRQTRGILQRRPVRALSVTHVGKESNRLEEVEAGLVHDPEEVYTEYADPGHDPWQTLVVPVLKEMPLRLIQEQTGLSRSQIKSIRNGHAGPHPRNRENLLHVAGAYARTDLRTTGLLQSPGGDLEACAVWLSTRSDLLR